MSDSRLEIDLNHVIDHMTVQDRRALQPHMRRVLLAQDAIVISQGEDVEEVHFPLSADLSNFRLLANGVGAEVSSIGRDGVSGLAAFLADEPSGWEVRVRIGGEAVSIPADILRQQWSKSPALQGLLLAVTHGDQVEAAQNLSCGLHHTAPSRLAKWLLTASDRTGRRKLTLTQQSMSEMLGVQRTTLNEAVKILSSKGAVRQGRGSVTIVDRVALRRAACECYAAVLESSIHKLIDRADDGEGPRSGRAGGA